MFAEKFHRWWLWKWEIWYFWWLSWYVLVVLVRFFFMYYKHSLVRMPSLKIKCWISLLVHDTFSSLKVSPYRALPFRSFPLLELSFSRATNQQGTKIGCILHTTLPTAEILNDKNARAWVSMVSYLKRWMKIRILKRKKNPPTHRCLNLPLSLTCNGLSF